MLVEVQAFVGLWLVACESLEFDTVISMSYLSGTTLMTSSMTDLIYHYLDWLLSSCRNFQVELAQLMTSFHSVHVWSLENTIGISPITQWEGRYGQYIIVVEEYVPRETKMSEGRTRSKHTTNSKTRNNRR